MSEGNLKQFSSLKLAVGSTLKADEENKRKIESRIAKGLCDPSSAKKLLGQGESLVDPNLNQVELAAIVTVASVILNLDELINK